MYIHPKSLIAFLFAVTAVGCVSTIARTPPDIECVVGRECVIEGNLLVFRGSPSSVAELKTPYRCFAVALSENEYRSYSNRNRWNVRVTGIAYNQTYADDVVSYRLRDRDVATGICSLGLVIYASKIEILSVR